MPYPKELMMTNKPGAQPGNQNAKKVTTSEMFACRLPDTVKDKIKNKAKELGISQAAYITLLVEADCKTKKGNSSPNPGLTRYKKGAAFEPSLEQS